MNSQGLTGEAGACALAAQCNAGGMAGSPRLSEGRASPVAKRLFVQSPQRDRKARSARPSRFNFKIPRAQTNEDLPPPKTRLTQVLRPTIQNTTTSSSIQPPLCRSIQRENSSSSSKGDHNTPKARNHRTMRWVCPTAGSV
jgi:hypothetical protein